MISTAESNQQRIRDRLAGKHILVTGSTGFLAKALIEKLLRCVDTVGGLHLLVRPRGGGKSPRDRVFRDVLRSKAFDRLRAAMGERFDELCAEKIHVISGDLTRPNLGIEKDVYHRLTEKISLIINSAATVTFDEQLDLAVQLNTLGPTRLLAFARDCGGIPFMHVSTCYVCGARTGDVVEDFSAPEPARESLPRDRATGAFDLEAIVATLMEEANAIKEEHGAGTERARRELIEAGMRNARRYGWNDTYTFTKWLGEQYLLRDHGSVPVAVFRPAIIESSYDEPAPGWIDGLRMADPIIVAHGKGKLDEFPARADVPIDFIPVDFVANAIIATLPESNNGKKVPVYQCASSGRHPFYIREISAPLARAFRLWPMTDDRGRPIHVRPLKFVEREIFLKRWEGKQRRLGKLLAFMKKIGRTGKRYRRLTAIARQIEQVVYFVKIYSPYTHLDCRFSDDALRKAADRLHPDDRELFPFDVSVIDWADYIANRHVPGIRSYVLGTGTEPTGRILAIEEFDRAPELTPADALKRENLFDVFRHSAERFKDKPALQIRRRGRWVRYTYDDALRVTGAITLRFRERGLKAGDRVAICAESSPEWGLTYLAIMRAGMTAVPLDPQMRPVDAWSAARFAGAKLMCASKGTYDGLRKNAVFDDPELVLLREPFVPPPGAARDPAPEPALIDGDSIASILFTSGTTIAPKAVPLTHRNLIANARALLQVHNIQPSDELLSVLPMYHAFEFTGGFLMPLVGGATITYVAELKKEELSLAMRATGTTVMLVVPRLLRMFLSGIENQVAQSGLMTRSAFRTLGGLSSMSGYRLGKTLFRSIHKRFGGRLRMFVCGGSRLDPQICRAFARMGFPVYEGYGLTETSPVITVNPPGANKPGSVGIVLPNLDIDIRNRNLEGIGEIWVKGPSVMSGYLNNREATDEVLKDDWFDTGDIGHVDGHGYLYITGRSKDVIVTGAGKNVYPDEVELIYRELPYVKELCVFGVDADDGIGDAVHAVAVIDPDAAPELDRSSIEREIRMEAERISESLPSHQRIAVLHTWERELPKTSTLKAKRGLIRDMIRTESDSGPMPPATTEPAQAAQQVDESIKDTPAWSIVCDILARQTKQSPDSFHPQTHLLLDLGIDSIGRIDVLGELESRYDMRIEDSVGAKVSRVSDLVAIVRDRTPASGQRRSRNVWKRRIAVNGAAPATNGKISTPLVPVRWFVRGGMGLFMRTYVRVHAHDVGNIPSDGPFILAPNHSSHLDTPSVLRAIGNRRRVWVAGAQDYFFNTAARRFIFGKVLDTIAFDRRADGVEGLRRCAEVLSRGDGVLIYPEGTRSPSGELQTFKTGIALLATERQVPIVPVHIEHTYDLFPKGAKFVRPGSVNVRFGEPIQPEPLDKIDDHLAAFRALAEKVQESVERMRGEAAS